MYDAFTPLMSPGESISDTIDLFNHGSSTDVVISDFVFDKTGEYSYHNYTSNKVTHEIDMGAILGATLNVKYTAGSGYNGTGYLRWALEGSPLIDTDICPAAGDTDINASYDLFMLGVDCIEDVKTLNIEFTNNDNDDDGISSVSFDVVNITVKYRTTELFPSPEPPISWVTVFDAVPNFKGLMDNTTDTLADVQVNDGAGIPPANAIPADGWYTVNSSSNISTFTTMYFDGFDMSPMGSSEQYIFAVVLNVRYSVDDGYSGNNYLQWALHGQPLQDTTIQPSPGQRGFSDTYDLYALGVDTIREISRLDISFINDDGGSGYDSMSFDYVGLEVKYRGLTGLQAENPFTNELEPFVTPPWPVGYETVETVKLVCNLIGGDDTTGDSLADVQTRDRNDPTPGEVHLDDKLYTVCSGNRMFIDGFETKLITEDEADWYAPGEIVLWLNETGLHKVNPAVADMSQNYPSSAAGNTVPDQLNFAGSYANVPQTVVPATPGLWENADMVRITAYSDFSSFGEIQSGEFNYSYRLSLMDWEWNGSYYGGELDYPVYFPCPSSDATWYALSR